jgi:sugar phosphate isomerase/epimerase
MDIKYICTYWGCENQTAKEFLSNVVSNGYDGVEINFPDNPDFISEFISELDLIRTTINSDFIFIAQQVLSNKKETVNEYIERITVRLEFLSKLKPNFINSHTGKDYYDFSDNCKIIELTKNISVKTEIPILHEIHRGRFSFHLKTLQQYLELFPKLQLIADFSHFCVVSESNLEDQAELLTKIYPKIKHIHARIGFEQSPQVNNPFAPEWQTYLERYLTWWKDIIGTHKKRNGSQFTITPEFGPFPYMPEEPFTKKPLSDQWETNLQMKKYLQQNL